MTRSTLLLFLCIISVHLSAQNLTGRWQGSFIANGDAVINNFTYELIIKENANHQITAQTITKRADQFYASAFAKGTHSIRTQLVQIEETSFEQIKIANELEACLMSNFLTYKNINGHEILEGSYMSTVVGGQRNCGSGKVFLEKVSSLLTLNNPKVDTKNIDTQKKKAIIAQKTITNNKTTPSKSTKIDAPNTILNASISANKIPPSVEKKNIQATVNSIIETDTDEVVVENEATPTSTTTQNSIRNQPINLPWVLVGRENKLVKKIITNSKTVSIDLFDNGTIDNDTIIVFDNKKLLVNKKRLSYKAIHLEFNFTENSREHEVIIVAHNMGTVPPNTALLLLKDGKNRQEYFITSTNKINAKILIVYEPPPLQD
ncbi:MAG: hypothetical protein ACOVJ1_00740 [Sediminibacterium sp.]|jgi:hypothetical protein